MSNLSKVDEVKYAEALLKNGLYDTYDAALQEAIRFNNKVEVGFVEPLKCYPNPDYENVLMNMKTGHVLVNYIYGNGNDEKMKDI